MTIEIFKYLVLNESTDIIAGFNSIENTKKFLRSYYESDDLNILIQESFGVATKISSNTFNEFY